MRLLRFFNRRVLKPSVGAPSTGQGGSSRMGSRSSAPRATILDDVLRGEDWLTVGIGGASAGGPRGVPGRERSLEFLRSLFMDVAEGSGAV